ncbi:hypothetical protein KP509_07G010700 [Ceratopteris richardii]|uniref:NmrA-like domain-containing protein n=1 Tax=Ceratopteris richardii TaxID=49495 RepID=A0A8T2UIE2_CERRI|nr:hypothetical protein KP509_07G010700 [Ceratopteris richardii]
MASKSKVLVIGATGYIGKHIALAGPAEGHPTFVLVRPSTFTSKAAIIDSFREAGITILEGSFEDHESLVSAIKKVDVVIAAVSGSNIDDQLKVIEAIKEAGTIKRFVPSEFGNDVDRAQALEPAKSVFAKKVQIRRAVEHAGIPHTFVVSNGFAGYFLRTLLQPGLQAPPRDKVSIYGNGDVKFINVAEEDIGRYTLKAVDDTRTLNKTLHIRPPENVQTLNTLVALWEKLINKTLEKSTVTEDEIVKQIQETPFPGNIFPAILHDIVILGDQFNFELGPGDVEATSLYPDYKSTSVEEYLKKFV